MQLEGSITLPEGLLHVGDAIWIRFVIRNQTEGPVTIVNPDVGVPPEKLNWRYSNETYQIYVLYQFHLLSMSLTTSSGVEVPQGGPQVPVTPILMPPLRLQPGNSLSLRVNLSDHFQLSTPGRMHFNIRYGERDTYASAETDINVT